MEKLLGALHSRVIWLNVITGTVEVANMLTGYAPAGLLVAVNVIGNIALRFLTVEPLAEKAKRFRKK